MKKRLLVLFLILFILPLGVGASSVKLSCPSSVNKGSVINCNVIVSSQTKITGLAGKFNLGSNFTYKNFVGSNNFSVYNASSSGFALGNINGKSGEFTIGVLSVLVNNSGSISLVNLDASDINDKSYNLGNVSSNIRIKSNDNNLNSLSITGGVLSPSFSSNKLSYSATVSSSSTTISGIKSNKYASVKGLGKFNLRYGKNTFKVVVRSESGVSKTYTLNIERLDNRSSNNKLKSLTLSNGNINFDPNKTNYQVNVNSNVSSIKVSASLMDTRAKMLLGSREVKLNYGNNNVLVKVQAENGRVKTYTIVVNRKDDRSSDNYLKSLTLSDGNINFDKNTFIYNTKVSYEVEKIDVKAVSNDIKSKVVVNSPNLKVGNNKIVINVTSERNETRSYIINVERLEKEKELSKNINVKSLKILGHELNFKNDILEYDVKIKDEYALVFNLELEDTRSKYEISGNEDLKDGSIITLTVISESGLSKSFKFKMIKVKEEINSSKEDKSPLMEFSIGFLTGIILTGLGFFIAILIKNRCK